MKRATELLGVQDLSLSVPVTSDDDGDILHLVYETALDNSLWPEMVLRISEHIRMLERDLDPEALPREIREIQTHFNRAFHITEKIIGLLEHNRFQTQLLNAVAFDILLFDKDQKVLFHSREGVTVDSSADAPQQIELVGGKENWFWLQKAFAECDKTNEPVAWVEDKSGQNVCMLLDRNDTARLGFPPSVQWAFLRMRHDLEAVVDHFAQLHDLSEARKRFLKGFVRCADLRTAAQDVGISYETARGYIKDICAQAGVSSQVQLLKSLLFSPSMVLNVQRCVGVEEPGVRRILKKDDGSQIEYFVVGNEDGYPIIFFDALTGTALDVLGYPERYLPVLERLGLRLITICRPGSFRSTYRPLDSCRDYGDDVRAICDALNISRFSILSYSYGSVAALGVAAALPDMVDRVTMSSAFYAAYLHKNWREMDFFYQIVGVLGRRCPALLNRVIPFLCKSIMQNIDRFTDRSVSRATCDHERAILMTQEIRDRALAVLGERIATGMDGLIEEYRIIVQPLDFNVADIKVPVQIFHGEHDLINPIGGAEKLVKDLGNGRLHRLPDMGHHHIFAEWDWLLAAAAGRVFESPTAERRGILQAAPETELQWQVSVGSAR